MVKIKIGSVVSSFGSQEEANAFVAEQAGSKKLRYKQTVYAGSQIESMDFLTYHEGKVSETYNTNN